MVEITKTTNFFEQTKKNPASGTRGLVSPVPLSLPRWRQLLNWSGSYA
jgi:hypothetical protein